MPELRQAPNQMFTPALTIRALPRDIEACSAKAYRTYQELGNERPR